MTKISLDELIADQKDFVERSVRIGVKDEIVAVEKEKLATLRQHKRIMELLRELKPVAHYDCDDSWYSCPKSAGGCCDERKGEDCICGAEEHNALLAKIKKELHSGDVGSRAPTVT